MKFRTILLIIACLGIGYGLGNVHKSKEAKEITEKTEAAIVKGTDKLKKEAKKGAKELSKKLSEVTED